jgi:threonine/homoserine/homoserine lactone efflux protein
MDLVSSLPAFVVVAVVSISASPGPAMALVPTHPASRAGWWGSFTEGLLVMLANPKAAVFMVVFYPQFVPPGRPLFTTTAVLAVLQVALECVLYLTLATAVARAGAWLRKPWIRRRLEAVTGTVLIGLGVRLAISQ